VDRFRDIATEMENRGYQSRFKGRTGDAKDGCATFWKSKGYGEWILSFVTFIGLNQVAFSYSFFISKCRLHLLEEDSIDFSEYNLRNNVAQIFVFEVLWFTIKQFVQRIK
jgi:hypothetical protein